MAQRIFDKLNNTKYVNDGKTARCPVWQTSEGWGRYYCTTLLKNQTVEGILQSWAEGYYQRDESGTRVGFQEEEVEDWLIPCCCQTRIIGKKYQYLAMFK